MEYERSSQPGFELFTFFYDLMLSHNTNVEKGGTLPNIFLWFAHLSIHTPRGDAFRFYLHSYFLQRVRVGRGSTRRSRLAAPKVPVRFHLSEEANYLGGCAPRDCAWLRGVGVRGL